MSAELAMQLQRDRRRLMGTALMLLSALSFSLLPILNRYAAAAGVNVPTLLAWRFAIAALVLWLLLVRAGRVAGVRLPLRRSAALGLMGSIYVAQSACFFVASRRVPVATASILLYIYPVIVTLLAWVFLRERLTLARLGALGLALLGVLLTLGAPQAGADVVGSGLALLAALVYSTYIVLGARFQVGVPARIASAYVMSTAALVFLAFGLATAQLQLNLPWAAYLPIAGLALLCTVVPMVTFFAGMERIGPAQAAIVSTVEPLGTAIMGALLLHERLGLLQLLGGALVLSAVLLLSARRS